MAKYLLAGESINWLAVLALLTFMIIFIMALILAFGGKKGQFAHQASLPLDDENDEEITISDLPTKSDQSLN